MEIKYKTLEKMVLTKLKLYHIVKIITDDYMD